MKRTVVITVETTTAPQSLRERLLAANEKPLRLSRREPVSIARPACGEGCWKCSRAGATECGRLDCGNRLHLTADLSAGAVPVGDMCGYVMRPRLF